MKQHTDEWIEARLGRATASCAENWMAELKTGGVPAVRKNYLAQLVLERLTNAPLPNYQSAAMLAGIELEPEARAAYAFKRNVDVVECGFIPHPRIAMAGASPDGLLGEDGLIEIKCPIAATHLDTLLRPDAIAQAYIYQMQFQMATSGRRFCDFVSYNNNFPEPMRLSVIRVPRDDKLITRLEIECVKFLSEVEVTVEALCKHYPMLEAA